MADSKRDPLIPIRKTAELWALAQDEHRKIYHRGKHLAIGMDYLPAVARRLYHSRDLNEPFDFLIWFEFAPEDEAAFSRMLARLRSSEEWYYVDRENRYSSGADRLARSAQFQRARKHRFEHVGRQSPCILVVARTMVAIDQHMALRHPVFGQMGKACLGEFSSQDLDR